MESGVVATPNRPAAMRLPDFIAIGPPRTGTTWLYRVLRSHVGLPRDTKETDFFSANYAKGLDWYADFFSECAENKILGELSPNYFAAAEAPDRIARLIPGCRIICTLRDPVDRFYSFYRLMRHNGWTRATIEELAGGSPAAEANRYAHYLGCWRERFGAANVLTAFYDDLEANPQSFMDSICEFIGIAPIPLGDSPLLSKRVNQVTEGPKIALLAEQAWRLRRWLETRGARKTITLLRKAGVWRFSFRGGGEFGPLDPDIERALRARFLPEIEALEAMLERDLSAWKRSRPRLPSAQEA